MQRYELSDQQWDRVAHLFPDPGRHGKPGRPAIDQRRYVNGILWILHTGAPWRDLPERYWPWKTVFDRFNAWRRDGTWVRVVTSLLDELDDKGLLDHDLWCIDGSVSRASRAAAGAKKRASRPRRLGGREETQLQEPLDHALGRSRGGFGTKIHLVCDSHGFIVAIHVTAGQRHESRFFEPTMARRLFHRRRGQRRWPRRLAGDKGYSYPRIRRWCKRHRVAAVIPTRKNQPRDEKFDKETYKRRNIVERVVGWYKEYRSLGTRYEKLAVNYVAMWLVAMMDKALHYLLPSNE
jgi:transposase